MLTHEGARAVLTGVSVRPLREDDLPVADRIMRLAFGTFLGLPDPLAFMGDAGYVRTRWPADNAAAFGAEIDGELAGSNFATNWGSVGFFGPLTIRPDLWDRGVASCLLERAMECFAGWGTRHAGLFTFAHSPKHVHLYQKFGFWPRFLTAIMSKPVTETRPAAQWSGYSAMAQGDRLETIRAARDLTSRLYDGLDLAGEIRAVHTQDLGDTVLVWDDAGLAGLAICHRGPGSEAGSGACFVKFGAARPGANAGRDFERLLDACESFAASHGARRLIAGGNMAREEAYQALVARGFRTDLQGVSMHRPNEPGYSRPGAYVIDDWR
jgi:GNAT superfamily N-acetyltransferase